MKQITLRPVAITDLSMKWARNMGGNKLRHYRISHMSYLVNDKMPVTLLQEHISKEEGEPVELIFETPNRATTNTSSSALQVEDISKHFFADGTNRDIEKSLKKFKANSLLTVSFDMSLLKRLYNSAVQFINRKVIAKVNRWLVKRQGKDPNIWYEYDYSKLLKFIPEIWGPRVVNLVHFLAVSFEKSQLGDAVQALADDLRILQKHDLIMGNLSLPSVLRLADTVGAGEEYMVLLCFPLIDSRKLAKALGVEVVNIPDNALDQLLVKYSNKEGSTKFLRDQDFASKWDIEVVDVLGENAQPLQAVREASIEAYQDSVGEVNKVAAKMDEALKSIDKSNSEK